MVVPRGSRRMVSPPSRGRQARNQTLGTNLPQTHAFDEHVKPEFFCSLTLRGVKDSGYLHITLMGVNPIKKGFRSHPLDRKSPLSKKKKMEKGLGFTRVLQ